MLLQSLRNLFSGPKINKARPSNLISFFILLERSSEMISLFLTFARVISSVELNRIAFFLLILSISYFIVTLRFKRAFSFTLKALLRLNVLLTSIWFSLWSFLNDFFRFFMIIFEDDFGAFFTLLSLLETVSCLSCVVFFYNYSSISFSNFDSWDRSIDIWEFWEDLRWDER